MNILSQRALSAEQLDAFYDDAACADQVADFLKLVDGAVQLTDVGGGCGHFATALMRASAHRVRVVDTDARAIEIARNAGVEAEAGDALSITVTAGDMASFNLVLHHLVGETDAQTQALQRKALAAWRGKRVFVHEYIYEGFFPGLWIYLITSSRLLSAAGRAVAAILPSLKANTFGVGVRFRSRRGWLGLFEKSGFKVAGSVAGVPEDVPLLRRLLLIRQVRRDSFLLES
jgi:hypothetical protein